MLHKFPFMHGISRVITSERHSKEKSKIDSRMLKSNSQVTLYVKLQLH